MGKRKLIIFIFLILLIGLVYLSAFTLNEKEFAIVTQFGKPVRNITEAGLYFKLPGIAQKVNRLDKRADVFKTQPIQLLLGDKKSL